MLDWYEAPPRNRIWWRLAGNIGWYVGIAGGLAVGWYFPEILKFILRMTLPV